MGWLMTLKNPVIRAAMRIYLDFIRIMPQLALLFLAYYGFARWFDWNLDATGACVLVFILWGGYARSKAALIDQSRHLVLQSVHPSPLSANRGGWFGNHHFSRANDYLEAHGMEPIRW